MFSKNSKDQTRQKVHTRIRKKLAGTQERPRLNVYRSENHIYAQVAASLRSSAYWQNHARSIGLKITRARSSGPRIGHKFIDVKMRLIALWHQSLAQREKSRNWTAFSNSNKGARKKVAYTVETRH